ncbi:MAG: nuclear transport factor 2 family protein [Acidobacteriota bacterium]|nr:nuclear transport factor 2 family protein [Acidobacteriota bacterium]
MRRLTTIIVLLLASAFAQTAFSQTTHAPAEPELRKLLAHFLAAASHSPSTSADREMFDRFFADDVLYTRSAGATTTKTEIMKSLYEAADPKAPTATFSAEDVTVHQYGNIAIVAFRLVQKVSDGTSNEFRNTGTFQRRKGKWQAIAWQATKIPAKDQPK